MESGVISNSGGIAVDVESAMFFFRRTDVNDDAGIGTGYDYGYYKSNAQNYYKEIANTPYVTVSNPNGGNASNSSIISSTIKNDGLQLDLSDINNGLGGLFGNDMIYNANANVHVAGVYTYYMDGVTFGKASGGYSNEPILNEAYDFTQGPKNRYQAVYLPTVTIDAITPPKYDNTLIALSGTSSGYNVTQDSDNVIYGKLTGILQTPYDELNMTAMTALQATVAAKGSGNSLTVIDKGANVAELTLLFTTTASKTNGAWDWGTITLPKSDSDTDGYDVKVYLEVKSTEQLDESSREYNKTVTEFLETLDSIDYSDIFGSVTNKNDYIYSNGTNTYARSSFAATKIEVKNRAPEIDGGVVREYKTIIDGGVKKYNEPTVTVTGTDPDVYSGDADVAKNFALTPGTYGSVTVGALADGKYSVRVGANHIGNLILTDNGDGTVDVKLERVERTTGGIDSVPEFTVPITANDGYGGIAYHDTPATPYGEVTFALWNQEPTADDKIYNLIDGDNFNALYPSVNINIVNPRDENDQGDTATVSFALVPVQMVMRIGYYTGIIPDKDTFVSIDSDTGTFTVPSNVWFFDGFDWIPKNLTWFENIDESDKPNTIVFDRIDINTTVIDNDAFNPLNAAAKIILNYSSTKLTKSVDKAERDATSTEAGDSTTDIKYTLTFENKGSNAVENVILHDLIPVGTMFKKFEGTVGLGDRRMEIKDTENITTGVEYYFTKVLSGDSVTVSFIVTVMDISTTETDGIVEFDNQAYAYVNTSAEIGNTEPFDPDGEEPVNESEEVKTKVKYYPYMVEYYKDSVIPGNIIDEPINGIKYFASGYKLTESDVTADLITGWINAKRPAGYKSGTIESPGYPVITAGENIIKVLYVKDSGSGGGGNTEDTGTNPSDPTDPTDPVDPTDPTNPTDPTEPTIDTTEDPTESDTEDETEDDITITTTEEETTTESSTELSINETTTNEFTTESLTEQITDATIPEDNTTTQVRPEIPSEPAVLPEDMELFEEMPDNAIALANGWFGADLGDGWWEIFNENGVPLGVFYLPDGESIADLDIAFIKLNLIPLANVTAEIPATVTEPPRDNPQTGDSIYSILVLLMLTLVGVVIVKKKVVR